MGTDEERRINPFFELRKVPTDPKLVKGRAGKAGKTFDYITREVALLYLDTYMDKWSWTFDLRTVRLIREQYVGQGTLFVTYKGIMKDVTCVGAVELKYTKDVETGVVSVVEIDYIKSVETDSLKRCCAAIGLFHDVYSEIDIHAIDPPEKFDVETEKYYIEYILPMMNKKQDVVSMYNQIKLMVTGQFKLDDLKFMYNSLRKEEI